MINLGGIDKVSPVWDYNLKKTPALIIFSLIGSCVNKLADGLKHIPYRGCDLYSHIEGLPGRQSPDLNAASSRSHAVFQVHIRMVNIKIGSKRTVRLSMINLGGIDKVSPVWDYNLKKTPALIIFSLIGNCVNKLADGLKHIPYRGCDLYSHIEGLPGRQSPDLNGSPCVNESPNLRGYHTTTAPLVQKKNFSCLYCKNVLKSVESKELYVNKRMLYLILKFPKAAR
uniref:Kinesin motor domain-containing protein n=1 Tax=Glossina morsitans morsitans TaxID=37546 RepID=A0A1B0G152_GLOMM